MMGGKARILCCFWAARMRSSLAMTYIFLVRKRHCEDGGIRFVGVQDGERETGASDVYPGTIEYAYLKST